MRQPVCEYFLLGQVPYQEAWALQDRLAREVASSRRPPTLLLLEHPHVYTFGRRGRSEHLLWGETELRQRGIETHWVDRGGDVTYHGPGQLVGYPILRLTTGTLTSPPAGENPHLPQADYVGYLRKLERVLILALARLGVRAEQIAGLTGVWVRSPAATSSPVPAKIAAIGVKVDARGVSRHGFALNLDPDMTYWQGIIACGLADYPVTSLAGLFPDPPALAQVTDQVIQAFGEVFEFEMAAGGQLTPT